MLVIEIKFFWIVELSAHCCLFFFFEKKIIHLFLLLQDQNTKIWHCKYCKFFLIVCGVSVRLVSSLSVKKSKSKTFIFSLSWKAFLVNLFFNKWFKLNCAFCFIYKYILKYIIKICNLVWRSEDFVHLTYDLIVVAYMPIKKIKKKLINVVKYKIRISIIYLCKISLKKNLAKLPALICATNFKLSVTEAMLRPGTAYINGNKIQKIKKHSLCFINFKL